MSEEQTSSRAEKPWDARLSMLFLVLTFAALAFAVPTSWVKKLNGLIQPTAPIAKGVFSAKVKEMDEALKLNKAVDKTALKKARVDIQLRRLALTGPMTGDEVRAALKQLQRDNEQIDLEREPASRDAMRNQLAKTLAKKLPRLQTQTIIKTLATFDAQYQQSMATE